MNEKPVIVLGNGGHAKVLVEILLLNNRNIIGYTAPSKEKNPYNLSYIGDDSTILKNFSPEEIELVNAIGSVSDTFIRKQIFNLFKKEGFTFCTLIHPSSIISSTAKLGEGVQIMAGTVIQSFAKIDDNTIINTCASIDHDCKIGKHCHISPGVILSGGITIGDGTHIGTGTKVIQNIKIGKNVLIGAGSVVIRDIEDNKIAYGVPAKEVTK